MNLKLKAGILFWVLLLAPTLGAVNLTTDISAQAVLKEAEAVGEAEHGLDAQLIDAVHNGMVERARDLLTMGANPNATSEMGMRPLYSAVVDGNVDMVQLLLDAGANPDVVSMSMAPRPLHLAIGDGNVAIVQALLNAGADINAVDFFGFGETALMLARREERIAVGNRELVEEMLRTAERLQVLPTEELERNLDLARGQEQNRHIIVDILVGAANAQ